MPFINDHSHIAKLDIKKKKNVHLSITIWWKFNETWNIMFIDLGKYFTFSAVIGNVFNDFDIINRLIRDP